MGDTITFAPNTGTNPVFDGRGSKIEHPDVLPIFWGSGWPGTGDITVRSIMDGLRAMVNGPYLDGLKQYGYVGPVQIRDAIVDRPVLDIALPAPTPGTNQSNVISDKVYDYLGWLLRNDKIDNVDDNHDLIIIVILDSTVPLPAVVDAAGKKSFVAGSNNMIEETEILDDNTRFEWAWVCSSRPSVADVLTTLSHELVEAITDPFGSGWHQVQPPPDSNEGQIADVCDQQAIVNGAPVAAYWSAADGACIVPTAGTRRIALSFTLDKHEPTDGPPKSGWVDLPVICGGGGYFDYHERTYHNLVRVTAKLEGYESPVVSYKLNGKQVPLGAGSIEVDVTRDVPRSNPIFPDLDLIRPSTAVLKTWVASPMSPELKFDVGPDEGNVSISVELEVAESFDNPSNGGFETTKRKAFLDIDLVNQEIIWESRYDSVMKNCNRMMHLSDGMGLVIGPPQPGDPGDLAEIITRAIQDRGESRHSSLSHAAELVKTSRPEVAAALRYLAKRGHT